MPTYSQGSSFTHRTSRYTRTGGAWPTCSKARRAGLPPQAPARGSLAAPPETRGQAVSSACPRVSALRESTARRRAEMPPASRRLHCLPIVLYEACVCVEESTARRRAEMPRASRRLHCLPTIIVSCMLCEACVCARTRRGAAASWTPMTGPHRPQDHTTVRDVGSLLE